MLPVVAAPEPLLLEDYGEHTASLPALNCTLVQRSMVRLRRRTTPDDRNPLKGRREHQDLLVEGTLMGHHQRVLAGIQGPHL